MTKSGTSDLPFTVLKKYLKKNLNKGFIRASSFSTMSSIFFTCKPRGGLQFYVNYKQLNIMTIKNQYSFAIDQKNTEMHLQSKDL